MPRVSQVATRSRAPNVVLIAVWPLMLPALAGAKRGVPPSAGSRVIDAHRERHTQWQHRKPVMRVWKRQRK